MVIKRMKKTEQLKLKKKPIPFNCHATCERFSYFVQMFEILEINCANVWGWWHLIPEPSLNIHSTRQEEGLSHYGTSPLWTSFLILSLNYFSTKRCYSFFIYNDKFRLGPIQPSRQLFTGFNDLINTLLLIFKYENYP